MVCLPLTPEWGNYNDNNDGNRAEMHGVEYNGDPDNIFDHANLDPETTFVDQDMPCIVCDTGSRNSVLMIPGWTTCPAGWTTEYWGYLMAREYDAGGKFRSDITYLSLKISLY